MLASLMRIGVVAIVLATGVAFAQPTAARRREGVRRAQALLRERVQTAQAAHMFAHYVEIELDERTFGTIVFAHVMPALRGGEGRESIVVGDDGHVYGVHGGRDVASLVRALGWVERPPRSEDLVDLVNAALLDEALDGNARPTIERTEAGALRLTVFYLPNVPSTRYGRMVIDFPRRGTVRVRRHAPDP